MDTEKLTWIECSMKEIRKALWEMEWEKQFGLRQDRCSTVILYLSWLLTDWFDCQGSFSPRQLAELLKEVADTILDCTEAV